MSGQDIRTTMVEIAGGVEVPSPDLASFETRVRGARRRRTTSILAIVGSCAAVVGVIGAVTLADSTGPDTSARVPVATSPTRAGEPLPPLSRWWKAEAQPSRTVVHGTGAAPVLDDALRRDLAFYAREEGLDVETFLVSQGGQGELSTATEELQRRLGEGGFLNARFSPDGRPAQIVLRSRPDAQTVRVLARLSADTIVVWGGTSGQGIFERLGPACTTPRSGCCPGGC